MLSSQPCEAKVNDCLERVMVLVSTLNLEIHQLSTENEKFETTVKDLAQEIKDLESFR